MGSSLEALVAFSATVVIVGRLAEEREPEIEELGGAAVLAEERVGGLDVAVDDARVVGGGERAREVRADRHDALGGEPAHAVEALAAEELGDEERPVHELAGVVHGQDVGMLQARHGACLDEEAQARLAGRRGEPEFQRDVTLEQRVAGEPDLAHPAAPQPALDAKLVDLLRRSPLGVHGRSQARLPARIKAKCSEGCSRGRQRRGTRRKDATLPASTVIPQRYRQSPDGRPRDATRHDGHDARENRHGHVDCVSEKSPSGGSMSVANMKSTTPLEMMSSNASPECFVRVGARAHHPTEAHG